LEYAAVIEPLVVCHHAAKAAGIKLEGLDVLILGGGPVGSALISILRAHNVGRIFLSEPTAKRKEQNKEAVDRVIDPRSEKVGDVCRELTGGKGVDVVFDCAGVQPGLEAGFDAMKHAGTFVNVAVWEKPVSLSAYAGYLTLTCYSRSRSNSSYSSSRRSTSEALAATTKWTSRRLWS
jgi:(R,R)-butanediol dehydrogenase/meso-butanediol dehydrogenase/diacetyl reductase